jgi:hypothetical protein
MDAYDGFDDFRRKFGQPGVIDETYIHLSRITRAGTGEKKKAGDRNDGRWMWESVEWRNVEVGERGWRRITTSPVRANGPRWMKAETKKKVRRLFAKVQQVNIIHFFFFRRLILYNGERKRNDLQLEDERSYQLVSVPRQKGVSRLAHMNILNLRSCCEMISELSQ